jgi:FtsZ-binding cell division protein ZapB
MSEAEGTALKEAVESLTKEVAELRRRIEDIEREMDAKFKGIAKWEKLRPGAQGR